MWVHHRNYSALSFWKTLFEDLAGFFGFLCLPKMKKPIFISLVFNAGASAPRIQVVDYILMEHCRSSCIIQYQQQRKCGIGLSERSAVRAHYILYGRILFRPLRNALATLNVLLREFNDGSRRRVKVSECASPSQFLPRVPSITGCGVNYHFRSLLQVV